MYVTGAFYVSTGSVGIGTSSPTTLLQLSGSTSLSKLSIKSSGNSYGQIQITNNVSGGEASIGFIGGDGNIDVIPTSTNGDAAIFAIGTSTYSAGTAKFGIGNKAYGGNILTVSASGNVGIGTNTPTATLEIAKANSGGVGAYLFLRNNTSTAANNAVQISFAGNSGGDATAPTAAIRVTEASNAAATMSFYTYDGATTTEKMRITPDGKQIINANAAAITGYGSTVQSVLVNGTNGAMTINSNGGSPYAYLNFAQAGTSKIEIGINGSGTNDGSFYINTNIQTGATGASLWVQKSNGYVGIGRITADYTLDVNGDIRFGRFRGINSLSLDSYATVNPSSNVYLYTTPNDRDMWIMLDSADTSSNWGMYYRQIDSALGSLPANSVAWVGGGNNGLRAFICLANGDYYFGGSNLSDIRSKHNINYISYSAIDKVKALKPATFYYNENPDISKGGFIAQDVKEVLPEFVTNKDDEKYMMGVDYYGIIAVLTKAIQELNTKLDAANAEIELLKNK
jgi:hypothetical protein